MDNNKKKNKSVEFDPNIKIFYMHVWKFAYREARKSNWMSVAADRYRFELRKVKMESMLTKINFFSNKK